MAKSYKGAAPLTVLPDASGTNVLYVYAEQPVPANADPQRVRDLVKDGFLIEQGSDQPTDASGGGQAGGPTADAKQ